MPNPDVQMLITLECEGRRHEIDFFDLRARERLAVEQQLDMPMHQVMRSQWLQSETVLTFAAYLAVVRDRPELSYDGFLDLIDEDKVSKISVRIDAQEDYSKLTKHQLTERLLERGIEPPAKAKHAELVALLEGDGDNRPT